MRKITGEEFDRHQRLVAGRSGAPTEESMAAQALNVGEGLEIPHDCDNPESTKGCLMYTKVKRHAARHGVTTRAVHIGGVLYLKRIK